MRIDVQDLDMLRDREELLTLMSSLLLSSVGSKTMMSGDLRGERKKALSANKSIKYFTMACACLSIEF